MNTSEAQPISQAASIELIPISSETPDYNRRMQEKIKNIWTNMIEMGQAAIRIGFRGIEQIKMFSSRLFKYFKKEEDDWGSAFAPENRYILPGLAIAMMSSGAVGYLGTSTSLMISAVYGGIYYGIFTGTVELARDQRLFNFKALPLIAGASYVMTNIFIKCIHKTPLTYQISAALALASFVGHAARVILAKRNGDIL